MFHRRTSYVASSCPVLRKYKVKCGNRLSTVMHGNMLSRDTNQMFPVPQGREKENLNVAAEVMLRRMYGNPLLT